MGVAHTDTCIGAAASELNELLYVIFPWLILLAAACLVLLWLLHLHLDVMERLLLLCLSQLCFCFFICCCILVLGAAAAVFDYASVLAAVFASACDALAFAVAAAFA